MFKTNEEMLQRNVNYHINDKGKIYYTQSDISNNIVHRIMNNDFDRRSIISEIRRKRKRKEYAQKRNNPNYLDRWIILKNSTNGFCPRCKAYVGLNNITKDHIIPISKEGKDIFSNIQPLCRKCNSSKYNHIEPIKCQ